VSNWLYRAAALISLLAMLAHEFLGGPMVLPPLADKDIAGEVVWLHHFSWHVGSVAVATMSAMFLVAAARPGNFLLALFATAMSIGFACLGVGLAVFGNNVLWSTPAPYFWSTIALLGVLGLWSSPERRRTPTPSQ